MVAKQGRISVRLTVLSSPRSPGAALLSNLYSDLLRHTNIYFKKWKNKTKSNFKTEKLLE
jgi:hypothetical protein